jgi:hypothetical protein
LLSQYLKETLVLMGILRFANATLQLGFQEGDVVDQQQPCIPIGMGHIRNRKANVAEETAG